jgi:hypothetical protein
LRLILLDKGIAPNLKFDWSKFTSKQLRLKLLKQTNVQLAKEEENLKQDES